MWQSGGNLSVTDTVFRYNDGYERGGAIYLAAGTARLTNVTFTENYADQGGGLYVRGGTALAAPTVTVTNGVFRDNNGSAVYNAGGEVTLRNTTLARNSGNGGNGVFSDPAAGATTVLLNTVVADNCEFNPAYGDVQGIFADASSANLIGVAADGSLGLVHGVNGNLIGSPAQPLDAKLQDLRPTAESPAVAAGDVSLLPRDEDDLDGDANTLEPLPLDAEGRARVSGGRLTIGAYQQAPPTVEAGGPYEVDEGGSIQLAGWASFDPQEEAGSSPVDYTWDMDGAGHATAGSTFSAAGLDGPQERTVTLVARNKFGAVATDQATILIRNVAPQVQAGSDRFDVPPGQPISFAGGFTDPGILDTHTILWDFGDGATAADTLTPAHAYAQRGIYTVTLTVTDNDGGVGSDTLLVAVGTHVLAAADSFAVDEDLPLVVIAPGVLANDVDVVGHTLTATKVAGPRHGILVFRSTGGFNYQPAKDWYGTDTFTYKAFDGDVWSSLATVTLTVHSVNDAPWSATTATRWTRI